MIKVLMWGMGGYYQKRKCWLPDSYDIIAFINSDISLCGTLFEGKSVILPSQINQFEYDKIIIASSQKEPIENELKKLNIDSTKIDTMLFNKDFIPNIRERKKVLTYFCSIPNIGDILNWFMLDGLFGINVIEENCNRSELVAIGSILDEFLVEKNDQEKSYYKDDTDLLHVWGTGFKYMHNSEHQLIRPIKVHALRGDYTRRSLSKIMDMNIECVLGDPGILVSLFWNKEENKKYDVGIIPHYVDQKDKNIERLYKSYNNVIMIDVTKNPLDVIKEISECKVILSTSLHGLIIADSFGIPNKWCECSDKVAGQGYKFHDYYSAFHLEEEAFDLRTGATPMIDKVKNEYKLTLEMVKQKQKELLDCFPINELGR